MIKPLSQETLETELTISDYRTTDSVLKWVPEAEAGGEDTYHSEVNCVPLEVVRWTWAVPLFTAVCFSATS